MPFIHVKTTETVDKAKETALKTKLGEAIALIPGKSEPYLMVAIDGGQNIYLGGKEGKFVFADVRCFGKFDHVAYENLVTELVKIFDEELGIPGGDVYITIAEYDYWGLGGKLFY
ncbi:hypothetical protein AGMMS49975_13300 [Clostridia bacterium]|nr:hypothetical protein AGMMS49975_13300 [Clostridia bacterium]